MVKFKKEITIVVEGESDKEYTEEEILSYLKIEPVKWWENNPNWPYGEPCKEARKVEILSVQKKN